MDDQAVEFSVWPLAQAMMGAGPEEWRPYAGSRVPTETSWFSRRKTSIHAPEEVLAAVVRQAEAFRSLVADTIGCAVESLWSEPDTATLRLNTIEGGISCVFFDWSERDPIRACLGEVEGRDGEEHLLFVHGCTEPARARGVLILPREWLPLDVMKRSGNTELVEAALHVAEYIHVHDRPVFVSRCDLD